MLNEYLNDKGGFQVGFSITIPYVFLLVWTHCCDLTDRADGLTVNSTLLLVLIHCTIVTVFGMLFNVGNTAINFGFRSGKLHIVVYK